jgi:hypothetical protein
MGAGALLSPRTLAAQPTLASDRDVTMFGRPAGWPMWSACCQVRQASNADRRHCHLPAGRSDRWCTGASYQLIQGTAVMGTATSLTPRALAAQSALTCDRDVSRLGAAWCRWPIPGRRHSESAFRVTTCGHPVTAALNLPPRSLRQQPIAASTKSTRSRYGGCRVVCVDRAGARSQQGLRSSATRLANPARWHACLARGRPATGSATSNEPVQHG